MNRIIIIGNGFDLAHGLKTSYKDLMEFIKEEIKLLYEGRTNASIGKCGGLHYYLKEEIIPYISLEYPTRGRLKFITCKNHKSYYFNKLFSEYNTNSKWVDLETFYFELLDSDNISDKIDTINEEFDYLKRILEDYLTQQIEDKIDVSYDFRNSFFKTKESWDKDDKILGVINFNYTRKLVSQYISYYIHHDSEKLHSKFSVINIHGELNNEKNPIIFGYGDDNSDKYKYIQAKGDNKLLHNFKTFQYLRNSNYKEVLSLLEFESDIKIEIIGHSCGLSDKTLLKTIFEHPNVSKIEYLYHGAEKNYFENLYNISRIFTDTALMRSKIVELSETTKIPSDLSVELRQNTAGID